MEQRILHPHPGPQTEAVLSDADIVIVGGSNGGGKGQPLDGLVWTPSGRKRMGYVQAGDRVLGPDGDERRVVKVHDLGIVDVYNVNFKDGTSLRVTKDHLWETWCPRFGKQSLSVLDTRTLKYRIDFGATWRIRGFKDEPDKTFESIEPAGIAPSRCISVDHEDNLYVAGEHPIVTHNTFTIVTAPIPCFRDPHFQGVMFSRTMPQVKNPGSLLEETKKWYPQQGADLHRGDYVWRLPAGGQIKLSGLQYPGDEEQWDGAQLGYLAFDQLEQFEKRQFFYLVGRMRSAEGMYDPFCFASCNPAPLGHWLTEFLDWWIGEDGFPIPERSGKKQYFYGSNSGWEWVDKDERRIINLGDRQVEASPLSVTFIPSKVIDNPSIMENDPAYVQKLNSLDYIDRHRKLHGNWHVSAKGGLFENHKLQIVDKSVVPDHMPLVRAWDVADTEPSSSNPDPAWTAGALCGITQEEFKRCQDCQHLIHNPYLRACTECASEKLKIVVKDVLWIVDMARFRKKGKAKKLRMKQCASADGKSVRILVETEPGSAGKDVARQYRNDTFGDYLCETVRPTGDKEHRATAWVSAAEEGRIRVVEGEWTVPFIREVEAFPFGSYADQVDAVSLAYPKLQELKGSTFSARWGDKEQKKPIEYNL